DETPVPSIAAAFFRGGLVAGNRAISKSYVYPYQSLTRNNKSAQKFAKKNNILVFSMYIYGIYAMPSKPSCTSVNARKRIIKERNKYLFIRRKRLLLSDAVQNLSESRTPGKKTEVSIEAAVTALSYIMLYKALIIGNIYKMETNNVQLFSGYVDEVFTVATFMEYNFTLNILTITLTQKKTSQIFTPVKLKIGHAKEKKKKFEPFG
ncbi:hypothetical protein ACJX0J_022609, partial [Zea mays]